MLSILVMLCPFVLPWPRLRLAVGLMATSVALQLDTSV
jgi:hypothetical protein